MAFQWADRKSLDETKTSFATQTDDCSVWQLISECERFWILTASVASRKICMLVLLCPVVVFLHLCISEEVFSFFSNMLLHLKNKEKLLVLCPCEVLLSSQITCCLLPLKCIFDQVLDFLCHIVLKQMNKWDTTVFYKNMSFDTSKLKGILVLNQWNTFPLLLRSTHYRYRCTIVDLPEQKQSNHVVQTLPGYYLATFLFHILLHHEPWSSCAVAIKDTFTAYEGNE